RDIALEKSARELGCGEAHCAEAQPWTTLPLDIDGRRVCLADHFDAVLRLLHAQVTGVEQRRFDSRLALLVDAVIEWLAFRRAEATYGSLHRRDSCGLARDVHFALRHPGRLPSGHTEERTESLVGRLQRARDVAVVKAVGFERGRDFLLTTLEEPANLRSAHVAAGVMFQ